MSIPAMFRAAAAVGAVLRVPLSREGIEELSAAAGYDGQIVAVLLDDAGEVCGRARRVRDPGVRYGPSLSWHVQIGGVIESRAWAARPMGCGCGATVGEAVMHCLGDLQQRAAAMASAADAIGSLIGR